MVGVWFHGEIPLNLPPFVVDLQDPQKDYLKWRGVGAEKACKELHDKEAWREWNKGSVDPPLQ